MAWWIWILAGFVFLIIEALTAGTVVVGFFAAGAFAVGLLVLVGLGGPLWVQFLLFSVLSLGSLALFRQPIVRRLRGEKDETPGIDDLVGEVGTAVANLPVATVGRVELRGTVWSARNVGEVPITAGTRVKVHQVRGLTLDVSASD